MKVTVINKMNFAPSIQKLHSDQLWLFAAKEWWRCYYDYVPHDTGNLRNQAKFKPKEIEHYAPYAAFIYFGMKMIDPKYRCSGFTGDGIHWWSRPGVKKIRSEQSLKLKNGSRRWDERAKQEKKNLVLNRSVQNWIEQNL